MSAVPAQDVGSDIGAALFSAIRSAAPLPRWISAAITIRPTGAEPWTILANRGRLALQEGDAGRADTTITGSSDTILGLGDGAESGIDAFLDGRLIVRGNLALSLRVAGMWANAPVTTGDVTAEGVRTFYVEAGEGPPVVLLHGLGATNASMLPVLRDLATDHRVIAPDLPGFGDSGKPLRSLHAGFYARWFAAFCDELGLQRPHVVGNSMGGRIAVEAGLRTPGDVDKLVLLAPSPAFLRGREYVRLVRILRPELALVPLPVPHGSVVRAIRGMFSRPSRLDGTWYDAAADEFLRVFSSPRGRICFFSAMRQIYLEEPHGKPGGFWNRLPQLSRPALFVWGERDRLVPAKFSGHVERALPDARSVILRDCGHVPHYELPQKTSALVRGFLADAG